MPEDKTAHSPQVRKTLTGDALDHKLEQFSAHDNSDSSSAGITESPTATSNSQASFFSRHKRALVITFVVFLAFSSILAGIGLYTAAVASTFKTQAQEAATHGRAALDQFKAQNLPGAEAEFKQLQTSVADLKGTYAQLGFYRYVPIAGSYYRDGENGLIAAEAGVEAGIKTLAAITPYADVLGFSGEGTFEGGSAENRVKLILDTLEKITPELDSIAGNLETANSALAKIDSDRYPETFQGIAVRDQIVEGKLLLANAATVLEDYRPILEKLPEIAGSGGERKKYLVLFQNDNELRPTGGFLTAYAVIFVQDGVVTPEKSDDIYEMDKKFNKKIPIPEALGRYLTSEKYFNLRDMNTSPDFRKSMDLFYEHYQEVPGEPKDIDGIIAVDTHVLNDLINVVGPIEIAGYGTFSGEDDPRCDCPQIIYALSEIITRPTPYIREDRKGILAPLMQGVLQRIYQSPKTFLADLFQIGLESIDGRHVQMYFFDPEYQAAAEAIHAAGRLENSERAEDFLAIVDANLGGAKSNLFVTHEVEHFVSIPENGKITKTIEITYTNPQPGDNCNLEAGLLCLNSTLRDWNRIYLPIGSEIIEARGYTQEFKQYEEDGFTVVDGFFILEPQSTAKIKLTYTVPYNNTETYSIKLWKQGGTDAVPNLIEVDGNQAEVLLDKDKIFTTDF